MIVVVKDESGNEVWRGELRELVRENPRERDNLEWLTDPLGTSVRIGGGATPLLIVERVGPDPDSPWVICPGCGSRSCEDDRTYCSSCRCLGVDVVGRQ